LTCHVFDVTVGDGNRMLHGALTFALALFLEGIPQTTIWDIIRAYHVRYAGLTLSRVLLITSTCQTVRMDPF
jgi:hypothetical protein